MPKKKVQKTTPKKTPQTQQDPQTAPVEEIGTRYEEQEDFLPDFEGEPGCDPAVWPEPPKPHPVVDPLPSFGEGPRRLEPHPVTPKDKADREHARNEQENFWIASIIAQNSKKPYGLLWLEAQREYQNRKIGPVQNWPSKISMLVEQKFRSLTEDLSFLRPLVRFHIRINNTPQVMPMTLYATYAAAVEALRLVLEDNFDEI